tara:strand:- start:152 stop:700 length:549 start_codon:yes stop_codon:yes gene_type:complete
MEIDPSHSKATILSIVKQSNLNITQPYLLSKGELFGAVLSELNNMEYEIEFYNPTLPFNNKEEFILFLGQAKEKLSYYETQQISFIAKNIISFVKSGYDYNKTSYNTYGEIECDVEKIKEYGDIFCVRTAIKYFNLTRDMNNQIECKISAIIQSQLALKNIWKNKCIPTLQKKSGSFVISFS